MRPRNAATTKGALERHRFLDSTLKIRSGNPICPSICCRSKQGLEGITDLGAQLLRGIPVDYRDNQVAGAAKQGDDLANRAFAEGIDLAADLGLPEADSDLFHP